ncbi:MAG TPA: polymer-forming cytoskeletal protein [Flavitalea sp.]|nr:polymer-forming cytoskeletal protein [Flavitalea sp.]
MFTAKNKSEFSSEPTTAQPTSASIIAAGTTVEGDITSSGDIRIDGVLNGNIQCNAKVIIGSQGQVKGDITGQQADIMGKVNGTIRVKELLMLKGGSNVAGNLFASKLSIEPSANFNGQCHMNGADPKPSVTTNNGTSSVLNTTSAAASPSSIK